MKKTLCALLSMIIFLSIFAPISVFAENNNLYKESYISYTTMYIDPRDEALKDIEKISGKIHPVTEDDAPIHDEFKGASYDLATNTLTLNNVRAAYRRIHLNDMGDDFKIKLIGYNEIGQISSSAEERGGSITLIGDGELIVRRHFMDVVAITIHANKTPSFFKAEKDVKLKLFGDVGSAIEITESSITDENKIFQLEGTVNTTNRQNFGVHVDEYYEKIKGYDFYYSTHKAIYDYTYKKGDEYYVGFKAYELDENNKSVEIGHYIFPIQYDEILECYATDIIKDYTPYLVTDYVSSGFEILAEENIPDFLETVFMAREDSDGGVLLGDFYTYVGINEKWNYWKLNLALSKDGSTKYAFFSYYDELYESTCYHIRKVALEHPKYGYIFIPTDKTISDIVPQVASAEYYSSFSIRETVIMNNGGARPKTVKLISAKNDINLFLQSGVLVRWVPVENAVKYRVYRKASGEKSWTILDNIYSAATSSFLDRTAKGGVKYTYTVKAFNYAGAGGYDKKGVSSLFLATPIHRLTNVKSGVNIKWGSVIGAESYTIYKKLTTDTNWTILKKGFKGTSYTDTTVKSGTSYNYAVRAVKGSGVSDFDSEAITYITTPTLKKIENTANGIKIQWSKISAANNYIVYRKTANTEWDRIGYTSSTSYTDKYVRDGVKYTYTVRAEKKHGGNRIPYASYYEKTGISATFLSPPEYTVENATNSIQIKWTDVAGATNYKIYRRVQGTSEWFVIASASKDKFAKAGSNFIFKDTSVKSGVTYQYAMRSISKKSASATSYNFIKRLDVPSLKAPVNTKDGINVSWKMVNGAFEYVVYRKVEGSSWERIGVTKTTAFLDTTAQQGISYTYTARAKSDDYMSYYNKSGVTINRTIS